MGRYRLLVIAGVLSIACAKADAETMRLRIAWGGGAECQWRGAIAVRNGTLSEPRLLGLEADESGSMWLDEGRLNIGQRSPRSYDGLDLMVDAPLEATLLIGLTTAAEESQPASIEVPLAELVQREFSADLDQHGNRLSVRRTPGDQLRVRLDHPSLVFRPGEMLRGQLEPNLLPMDSGSKVRLTMRLVAARTATDSWPIENPLAGRGASDLWSAEQTFVAGEATRLPLEVPVPKMEGAYDLVITATHAGILRFPQPGRAALVLKQPMVERRVQLVVLSPDRPMIRTDAGPLKEVVEIDPANPKWWERFAAPPSQLGKLPRLWKGPLGNGRMRPFRHALDVVAQLAPSPISGEVSWEAYTLPINRPGLPHVLEIDYPSDVAQTMGISVVEPNAAGAVIPIGLDSGIDQAEPLVREPRPPEWLHHRVVFWPRTKSPIVLISNRRSDAPAMFGRIRVLDGWEHLPPAFVSSDASAARLWAAYLDRPLVPENFSASEALGSLSDLSVDDWRTFYEGGTRLVEYLNHVGYGGLMLSVFADGSTLYPSKAVEPTPRYDTGVFLAGGQDPLRKDVLEMLFRLFDREQLQLIPALEFGSPLAELEAILRAGGPASDGIQWVGPDGRVWQQVYPTVRGLGAYYNILHPQVQEAMLAVIREVTGTYGGHPSFAGLAMQLSGNGYAQLPGPHWGMDDATIARFQRDTKIEVLGAGPQRFAQRAQFLNAQTRQAWLQWRADQLARFYQRVRDEVRAARPQARLYLAGANLFSGEGISQELMPTLPRRCSPGETMLRLGIDLPQYQKDPGLVLLRPEIMVPHGSLADQAVHLEIDHTPDWDRLFQAATPSGSLFFHKPQEVRVASFDEMSPFRPTYTWLATQPVPSGHQNRRRFVHALATLDVQSIFDGGWQLSMGQENAFKELLAIYRRLPPVRFEPVAGPTAGQPVTIRTATHGDRTCAYVVNDAPFASELRVRVAAPAGCRIEEFTGLRQLAPLAHDADGAYWSISLAPYDLVAVEFSAPGVRLYEPKVSWSGTVYATLQRRIAELGDRRAALLNAPLLSTLANGDFEQVPGTRERIPGWSGSDIPGAQVVLDSKHTHGGSRAVHISTSGPVASLVSQPFEVPSTGRLSLWVWLRVADPAVQPQLSISIEGHYRGAGLYRSTEVGRSAQAGKTVPPIHHEWQRFVVPIRDLPLEGLSPLQLRFDMIGPGELWIDDILLSSLEFNQNEHVDLVRLIAPADAKLQNGQIGDCIRLLESYWPRFLVRHVALPELPVSQKSEPVGGVSATPPKAPTKSFLGRMKQMLPEKLRF